MFKNIIKTIGLVTVIGMSLNASSDFKEVNTQYEKQASYGYVKLKTLPTSVNEFDRIIPCSNIPKKIYIADKFFANLKAHQIIVCDDFIYKADVKAWYVKQ